ncbi:MAG: orotidine-5'-phosphate decarboxylase [Pseudomonadota bacterium]
METSPIIVALDFDDAQRALALVNQFSPERCRLKVGKQMFTLFGPDFVKTLVNKGYDVFLDLKFHDIPNTVAKAVEAAVSLGVWMVNVHASGGAQMIEAAKNASLSKNSEVLLTAVTILTSMDEQQVEPVYGNVSIPDKVKALSMLARNAGADGVVCSAQEAIMLRDIIDQDFKLVTPGIRPAGSKADDQSRIMTPQQAISSGVNYLVIGRPITNAADPARALDETYQSLLGHT